MEKAAANKVRLFSHYVNGVKVLDIGLGNGSMAKVLQEMGNQVTSLDVVNKSLYADIQPTLYDGLKMPFTTESRDLGLLICVLHHCSDQTQVLSEAMRVCKRLVIIEDTYRNPMEKLLVSWRDQIGNGEFYYHHYRIPAEWERLFRNNKWKIVQKHEWSNVSVYGMYGHQVLYVIEPR